MTLVDDLGQTFSLKGAHRVVSLVPSISELIHALRPDALVGVTTFCIHPRGLKKKVSVIGGTKTPRIDRILKLNPEIVIANKEENNEDDIRILQQHVPVFVSDIKNLEDNHRLIRSMGLVLDRRKSAEALSSQLAAKQASFKPLASMPSVLYLIWKNPYMSIGADTFIHHMLEVIGCSNILKNEMRYPSLTPERASRLSLDMVMLSSEPYPFKEKDVEEVQAFWPSAKIVLVDGEYFSWYGNRPIDAFDYFDRLKGQLVS